MNCVHFFIILLIIHNNYASQNCPRPNPATNQLSEYFQKHRENQILTTSSGIPLDDIMNVKTVGARGPIVLEDTIFLDAMSHFDRERIPERVVHAKGAGAMGYFMVTNEEIRNYCKAVVFSQDGKVTPVMIRFSTVVGERGSPDTARDVRGFAVKFYTEKGNWDLVANHVPIFAVSDPFRFMSFIHSQKRNPVTNLADDNTVWDFFTSVEETTNLVFRLFSDLGTPDGYRYMDGHSINVFKLVNASSHPVFCKFTFKTDQGIKNLTAEVAERLMSKEPDYATKDLYNAIAEGRYPSWTMYFQVMSVKEAEEYNGNPFDATKEWLKPLIKIGKIILTTNPKNYFAEVEQVGFAPSNLIPGIEASPDKILQGRLFSYVDTQHHRLGPNSRQLPINRPRSLVRNTQRDGLATYTDNQKGAPNYFPSSFANVGGCTCAIQSEYSINGTVKRYDENGDHFTQPRMFWKSLSSGDQKSLIKNIASSLKNAKSFIQERALKLYGNVDSQISHMLAKALECTY